MKQAPQKSALIVIGAGPKAMAILAKRKVLSELGFAVPNLIILEQDHIGAHWSGDGQGFTDGAQKLGTSPEKDVGFPYNSRTWGPPWDEKINSAMFAYSWQRHLINRNCYGQWIDRGRPHPTHVEWMKYLNWVHDQASGGSDGCLKKTRVQKIGIKEDRWIVSCSDQQNAQSAHEADGLVFTGPGRAMSFLGYESTLVSDGKTFWKNKDSFRGLHENVAVIGTGETAASIVVALLGLIDKSQAQVEFISRSGFVHSRGESYLENEVFTNPHKHWREIPLRSRQEFIARTDRGVISPAALEIIGISDNVRRMFGHVIRLEPKDFNVHVTLQYTGGRKDEVRSYKRVVDARGFDPLWWLSERPDGIQFEDSARGQLEAHVTSRGPSQESPAMKDKVLPLKDKIVPLIEQDLSIGGFAPRLHLPMLAGLEQGPGFPNLSCLGTLADCILKPYSTSPT